MGTRNKKVLWALVALVVVLAGVGGWMLRSGGPISASGSNPVPVGTPTIVSTSELEDLAGQHYPLYWAGERPDTKIEVTVTRKNAIFVRYLPQNVPAGDPGQYLTVATYYAINGYEALRGAQEDMADVAEAEDGALIAVFHNRSLSTYFSFKNGGFQTEVFSPMIGESKQLTDNGTIKIVGGDS
ncbi:hypothetical protein [Saccharopolyspora flava]|uniref:Uncharacterized protein n=1 Tax=Saccharopolyspora flava TaxID=95161 RepID=A0A1I6QS76_9PSEU|nr:hypothetical protein [Saccharopolyspora flava]SFS55295.1 hypothetical protein SAMN05660874_01786 [Saccharopolyspora flava]